MKQRKSSFGVVGLASIITMVVLGTIVVGGGIAVAVVVPPLVEAAKNRKTSQAPVSSRPIPPAYSFPSPPPASSSSPLSDDVLATCDPLPEELKGCAVLSGYPYCELLPLANGTPCSNYGDAGVCTDAHCIPFDIPPVDVQIGCGDPSATNYCLECDEYDLALCEYPPPVDVVPGCMNLSALNYSSLATEDDGSCIIPGCMNSSASNYNPAATQEDGSCVFPVLGCMSPSASNYNPAATQEDGSCVFSVLGCMSPSASNYNPSATQDDDSCVFEDAVETCEDLIGREECGVDCDHGYGQFLPPCGGPCGPEGDACVNGQPLQLTEEGNPPGQGHDTICSCQCDGDFTGIYCETPPAEGPIIRSNYQSLGTSECTVENRPDGCPVCVGDCDDDHQCGEDLICAGTEVPPLVTGIHLVTKEVMDTYCREPPFGAGVNPSSLFDPDVEYCIPESASTLS